MDKIYRFTPYLKSVIWGGDKIAAIKGIDCDATDIGESWEISAVEGHESVVADGADVGTELGRLIERYRGRLVGEKVWREHGTKFPLLIKFIDANGDLSVQVHPDDRLAAERHGSRGKTEVWYIIGTRSGARIYCGLSERIDAEEYTRRVADNTIMEVVKAHESAPGDVYFLPAGRIHAIGAGNLLLEIQQTSDITYRIYDYDRRDAEGNPRRLHTELAKDAIDYTVYPDYRTHYMHDSDCATLADCKYFTVRRYKVHGRAQIPAAPGSFTTITCIEGQGMVNADGQIVRIRPCETLLVAAEARDIAIEGDALVVTGSI